MHESPLTPNRYFPGLRFLVLHFLDTRLQVLSGIAVGSGNFPKLAKDRPMNGVVVVSFL